MNAPAGASATRKECHDDLGVDAGAQKGSRRSVGVAPPRVGRGTDCPRRRLYGSEESPGWQDLIPKLGNPLAIKEHGIGAKDYPCCMGTHRTLDGVLELRKKYAFKADDVAAVETKVASSSAQNLMYPSPKNEMQARFSMPDHGERFARRGAAE